MERTNKKARATSAGLAAGERDSRWETFEESESERTEFAGE